MKANSWAIEGLRDLQEKLRQLESVAGIDVCKRAARRAFKIVETDAKALVPVKTGQLRDCIKLTAQKPKNGSIIVRVGLKVTMTKVKEEIELTGLGDGEDVQTYMRRVKRDASWRWHYVEFGTSRMSARPFLRPAFEKNARRVVELFKEELDKSIQRAARKELRAILARAYG